MKRRKSNPIESPWFSHALILVLSLGIGGSLSVPLIFSAGNDGWKIAFALAPLLVCFGTGYLILLLSNWLARSGDG